MKTDKAFLEIDGKTFLSRAAETLSTICENQIKIVLNQTQTHFVERLPAAVSHIYDAYKNRGAPGGIHAALKDCETKYAIILAVDLPLVTGEAIARLKQIALESNEFSAVVPVQTDGRLQPLCAVYRAKDCLPVLENFLSETTSASVRDFLKLVPIYCIEQKDLLNDKNLLLNVNNPNDFVEVTNL